MSNLTLTERIQGTPEIRILRELVTNSAIFPIFDAIRAITSFGAATYFSQVPHYMMFFSAGVQAVFLGRRLTVPRWQRVLGNLIAPSLYTLLDVALEGPAEFINEPYHWVFWVYSGGMALLYLAEEAIPVLKRVALIVMNLWRVMLFPSLYVISELSDELVGALTWQSFGDYWNSSSGHPFILLAALIFGLLMGLNEMQLNRYTHLLRDSTQRLKQFSEWSLDLKLIEKSLDNPDAMRQRRVERTVLFMDIRGFTQWSEDKDPETVVGMLNRFYELAEGIIISGGGSKPHFIADEVLTWFEDPQQAIDAGRKLSQKVNAFLESHELSAGVGLHIGDVVEGLMGSTSTRNFNIIGDVVNTASRLESATGPGEILISDALARKLSLTPRLGIPRAIRAKGKRQMLMAYRI